MILLPGLGMVVAVAPPAALFLAPVETLRALLIQRLRRALGDQGIDSATIAGKNRVP